MEIRYRKIGRHKQDADAHSYLMTLFRDTPLYLKMPLSENLQQACFEILFLHGMRMDTWCVDCQKESTFTLKPFMNDSTRGILNAQLANMVSLNIPHELEQGIVVQSLRWITFSCARSAGHSINYVCKYYASVTLGEDLKTQVSDIALAKIGQNPSPADISIAEIRKYSKELSKADFREFTRAIGLVSHDIGIGSFVYLRRIIERLIDQTAKDNLEAEALEEFAKQRIKEKIAALKDWLPTFLVENTSLYVILSKGIHELTEEECLGAFEPCRVGIELILDEHIAKMEKEQKIEAASRKLSELNVELKDT